VASLDEREASDNPEALATGNSATGVKHNGKYTVQSGETLMMIMRQFDCDLRRLISENDLSPPDYIIKPGQEIKLAGCKK
jgi:membrane-bound lytic murein transglycosylase D